MQQSCLYQNTKSKQLFLDSAQNQHSSYHTNHSVRQIQGKSFVIIFFVFDFVNTCTNTCQNKAYYTSGGRLVLSGFINGPTTALTSPPQLCFAEACISFVNGSIVYPAISSLPSTYLALL